MESVENIAIQTYQNNMNYFSRQHPSLYKLITSFSEMLETGVHPQEYDLEYINGYFDIINLATTKYIYNENSEEFSQSLSDEISFKKNEMVFNNINVKKSSEAFLATLSDKTRSQKSIYELVNYTLDNSSKDDSMNKIEKFIFIGVCLGKHIELIDKKIKSSEYLIIEDNLEFFRLSLFVTKYYEVGQSSKLHFCIAQDENMFTNSMQIFMDNNFVYNKQFKYLHFKTHSQDKIKRIQNTVVSQDFLTFPYGLVMEKHLRALEFINSGYNILDLTEHFDDKLLTTMPVLMLAAGPSFEKNIEWIKENHKKFVIVAVSAVLKRLFKIGVKPDIVTHLDGFGASVGYYKGFNAQDFLKDTIFIFESFTPTVVREMFPKENIFQFEGDTYYSNKKRSVSAPCIGSLSLFISLLLNAKELYLLGLDLSVDQETGETHSLEHSHSDETDIKNKETFSSKMSLLDTFIPVAGNLQDKVYTIPLYTPSIQSIFNNIESIKTNEQNIYNLSEGVKLREIIGVNKEKIDIEDIELNKKDIYSMLYKILTNHSIEKIDQASEKSFVRRYEYILKIKEDLDDSYSYISYVDPDKYMNSLVQLLMSISNDDSLESMNIREVYYKYFLYILPIIVDFFNTKGLSNKKRHIKKIDVIVKKELYEIQNIYETAIEKFIKIQKIKYALEIKGIIAKQNNYYENFNKLLTELITPICTYDESLNIELIEYKESIEIQEDKDFNLKIKIDLLEKLKTYTDKIVGYNEYVFTESLKDIGEEVKSLYLKGSIGFLAVSENLEDKDFLNYIKELCFRFPEITFKVFYFDKKESKKFESLFLNSLERFEFIVPNNMNDIVSSIEIYLSNGTNDLSLKIGNIISSINENIHYLLKNKFISKSDTVSTENKILFNRFTQIKENIEMYGYSKTILENSNNSFSKLIWNQFFKNVMHENKQIEDNRNLYELTYFDTIEYSLKSQLYKKYIFDFLAIHRKIKQGLE